MRLRRETERSRPSAAHATSAAASTPRAGAGGWRPGHRLRADRVEAAAERRRVDGPSYVVADATRLPPARSAAAARSWTLQEPEIERREYQDNSDVHHQPLPEVVPEEQDVHADHDGYHREHVKHAACPASHGCPPSHRFILVCAMSARLTCATALIPSTVLSRDRELAPASHRWLRVRLREQCQPWAGPRASGSPRGSSAVTSALTRSLVTAPAGSRQRGRTWPGTLLPVGWPVGSRIVSDLGGWWRVLGQRRLAGWACSLLCGLGRLHVARAAGGRRGSALC